MLTDRFLLQLGYPLRALKQQFPLAERMLKLQLNPGELESVLEACVRSGSTLGGYYYWYLQKQILARNLRGLDRRRILKRLSSLDLSEYESLIQHGAIAPSTGLIIAVPHHAHYILSIIAIAEHLRHQRQVLVFYGSPETHAGNELFDELHGALFRDEMSNVRVIHDTRSGLTAAIDGLRNGAAVIIMPDVHKQERDTYLLPFCGRPLNVMLGTAALARKTRSRIVPAVSLACRKSLFFRTRFKPAIEPSAIGGPDAPREPVDVLHQDYTVTVKLFQALESEMAESIYHWQYARAHYKRKSDFPHLDLHTIETTADLFFKDPRIRCSQQPAISIPTDKNK